MPSTVAWICVVSEVVKTMNHTNELAEILLLVHPDAMACPVVSLVIAVAVVNISIPATLISVLCAGSIVTDGVVPLTTAYI